VQVVNLRHDVAKQVETLLASDIERGDTNPVSKELLREIRDETRSTVGPMVMIKIEDPSESDKLNELLRVVQVPAQDAEPNPWIQPFYKPW
jgi:hypothetical protein